MERVLFIDRENTLVSLLGNFFEGQGFAVDCAQDRAESWRKIAENRYSFVFYSLLSDALSDIEFVSELRKRIRMPSEIFVVGPDRVPVAVQALQLGARHYWTNPVDVEEVQSLFNKGLFSLARPRLGLHREGTLLQIIKEISLTMELDGLVNILMDSAMELTGADGGGIFLYDEKGNGLLRKAVRGLSGPGVTTDFFGMTEKEFQEILFNRQPVFLHDLEEPLRTQRNEQVNAMIIAPIWWKEEPLGLIVNVKYAGTESFSNDDFKLLSLLSEEIAGAVHNAITHYKTKELTIKDDLTEAYNRRYFEKYLEEELVRATRYSANLSLIFFDVDNLKEVNVKYGHLIGSKTLQEIARRMILTVRGIDKVVRYGGDEFCVVLPETDTQGAYQVADRIRNTIAGKTIRIGESIQIHITGSIGIASFPIHASSKEELVRQADRAMFVIKNKSKNAIAVAEALPLESRGSA